jgi:hypothetical protein
VATKAAASFVLYTASFKSPHKKKSGGVKFGYRGGGGTEQIFYSSVGKSVVKIGPDITMVPRLVDTTRPHLRNS